MSEDDSVQHTFKIPIDLNKAFRRTVTDIKGYKKGTLSIAFEEAIEDWVNKYDIGESSKKRILKKGNMFKMRITCTKCKRRFISEHIITENQIDAVRVRKLGCSNCNNIDDYEKRYIEFIEQK